MQSSSGKEQVEQVIGSQGKGEIKTEL